MLVKVVEEHDDGSATVVLEDVEPKMMQLIVQEGLIALLTKEIKRIEVEGKLPALLKRNSNE